MTLVPGGAAVAESSDTHPMTDTDRTKVETWTSLADDKRRRLAELGAGAPDVETVRAEAERLETLINFYKASLAA